jgi:hypothetical protein
MNQTSWIAAFIFIGFFVYITVKGQLPQFQAVIFGGSTTGGATAGSTPAPSQSGSGTAGGSGSAPD